MLSKENCYYFFIDFFKQFFKDFSNYNIYKKYNNISTQTFNDDESEEEWVPV